MKIFIGLLLLGISCGQALATSLEKPKQVQCFIQLTKASCWQNNQYTVTLSVVNALNLQPVKNFTLAKDKNSQIFEYDCQKLDQVSFQTRVSPSVFSGRENITYPARKIWLVPKLFQLPKDSNGKWYVDLCFHQDFNEVPIPSGLIQECNCKKPALPDVDMDKKKS